MRLTLDPQDLAPEHQTKTHLDIDQACSTSKVHFGMFTPGVQRAITAAGRAVFYAWDRRTHNAIYPTQESPAKTASEGTDNTGG